jgi:hypothetical protein
MLALEALERPFERDTRARQERLVSTRQIENTLQVGNHATVVASTVGLDVLLNQFQRSHHESDTIVSLHAAANS